MPGLAPDATWHKPDVVRPRDTDPITVLVDGEEDDASKLIGDGGLTKIALPDGSINVSFSDLQAPGRDAKFDENLAEHMDDLELGRIAEMLLEGIDADLRSREEWLSTRDKGIDLLGLKLDPPRTGPGGGSTGAPLQGMSTAKDPTLTEAVIRGQANAIGEFLPSSGPAKIEDVGDEDSGELAELLEKDFNYFLTTTATEYYPDTKRMFAWLYFGGCGFKKVYHCPIRRRPVSESIDAQNLIVSNAATDLMNADRVTHMSTMRRSRFRRMLLASVYRDVELGPPTAPDKNRVEEKLESVEGVRSDNQRPEDQPYTIYECYCELEIDEDPKVPKALRKGKVPVPYRVSIEKDSRVILEIRRHWAEEDEEARAKRVFVKYSFIDWVGFYGIGLLQIIGNLQIALTAMLRIAIDSGMFANFPGGLSLKNPTSKQLSNQYNPGPGEFPAIDATGLDDIRKVVMALPYHDTTQGLLALMGSVREYAQRVGGTADLPVAEGRADIPVGTMLALVEQATKVESAVHKGMHQSQSEEFELLIELFREDPEAFWRHRKDLKKRKKTISSTWDEAKLLQALDDFDLVPKSDPNTPSHIHRIMKIVALLQLVQQSPQSFNLDQVLRDALHTLGYSKPEKYLKPPSDQPPPPTPEEIAAKAKMLDAQTKQGKALGDVQNKDKELQDKAAQRQSEDSLADKKLAAELVIHSADHEKIQAETGLAARKQAHEEASGARDHGLAVKEHGLEAFKAAHDAAVDAHAAGLAEKQHGLAEKQQGVDAQVALNPPAKPAPAKPAGKK